MDENSLGKRIRALRRGMGLTQEQLAVVLDLQKQAIYKYETGVVTNVPLDKIEKMASFFKVSPAYIVGWDQTSQKALLLSEEEEKVIKEYRELSKTGKEEINNYIEDLSSIKKYKK